MVFLPPTPPPHDDHRGGQILRTLHPGTIHMYVSAEINPSNWEGQGTTRKLSKSVRFVPCWVKLRWKLHVIGSPKSGLWHGTPSFLGLRPPLSAGPILITLRRTLDTVTETVLAWYGRTYRKSVGPEIHGLWPPCEPRRPKSNNEECHHAEIRGPRKK